MLVRECMTRDVETTHPEATAQEVAERMRELDLGSMPVCETDELLGMLTDRDIVIRCVADGRDPAKVKVLDVMTRDVVYCYDDQGRSALRCLPTDNGGCGRTDILMERG